MPSLTELNLPARMKIWPNDQLAVDQGCYFDFEAALRVKNFFEKFLRHSKGHFRGKPFSLLDWQWFDQVMPLYGWKLADGTRRFRNAFTLIPKKNGKSTLCAGLALYHLIADREGGAEVYAVAGSRDQASIVFNESMNMVISSTELAKRLIAREAKKELFFSHNRSVYKVLSSEAGTHEGLNASTIIFDELHTQPNRKLWDTLKYAGAFRTQPLTIVITTAGDEDQTTIFAEQLDYATRVSTGEIPDIQYLPVIYKADIDDDIMSPETWKKANPSYGVTISEANMRQAATEAVNNPQAINAFLRYRLDINANLEARWLPDIVWVNNANLDKPIPPAGSKCYAAFDLSHSIDIGGYVLYFPEYKYVMPRLWAPNPQIEYAKQVKRQTKYDFWARKGLLTVMDTEVLDYDVIKQQLDKDDETYKIIRIAMDPWNATQFQLKLSQDGYEVEKFRQGFQSMTGPMKELERLLLEQLVVHHGNEILRWMFGNMIIETDVNTNIRPAKKKSKASIDGIVMLLMALGLHMIDEQLESIYKTRGIIII